MSKYWPMFLITMALALLVLAIAGCQLFETGAVCLDQVSSVTSPDGKPIQIEQKICVGRE